MNLTSKISIVMAIALSTFCHNTSNASEPYCIDREPILEGKKNSRKKVLDCGPSSITSFNNSFDYNGKTLLKRVNAEDNFHDLMGFGPYRYPENRMVYEAKELWDNFQEQLQYQTSKEKKYTDDIFNGYDSSLSQF